MDAILLAGPTASGKSALALRLAGAIGGAVVNADSMQAYRDLRVLTARPSPDEEAAAPHRLYGHVDGAEAYSAARYAAEVAALLPELDGAGLTPIVVGGTGLYFEALTAGLSDMPAIPPALRARLRAEAEGRPTLELHARLARLDGAAAARLRPSDRQRVLRALEVAEATGRSILSYQDARRPGPLAGRRLARLFLVPEREALGRAIDRRFAAMIERGALDEVRALARRGLDPALPVMRAHGVPALLAHLRGAAALDEAVRRGQADTRAYAKRQMTWFRGRMAGWTAVPAADATLDAGLRALRDAAGGAEP